MKHLKDQMRKAVSNHIREARSDATEGKMFSKNFIYLCMVRLNIKYIDFNFNLRLKTMNAFQRVNLL